MLSTKLVYPVAVIAALGLEAVWTSVTASNAVRPNNWNSSGGVTVPTVDTPFSGPDINSDSPSAIGRFFVAETAAPESKKTVTKEVCGNTINTIGLLNPALGNACIDNSEDNKKKKKNNKKK